MATHEIQIIINDKPQASNDLKTAALPRRRGQSYGRRRIGFRKWLKVFDLHCAADGTDIPLKIYNTLMEDAGPGPGDLRPYYFASTSLNLFGGPGDMYAFSTPVPEATSKANWNNYILPGDINDLPEGRKDITAQLSDYGITFDGALSTYTVDPEKGIGIPNNVTNFAGTVGSSDAILWQLLENANIIAWIDKELRDELAIKITKLPSYDSPSETLTVDRSIDVFLAPSLYGSAGHSRVTGAVPPSPYIPQTWYWNMGVGQTVERSVTLNNPDWDAFWAEVLANDVDGASEDVKNFYFDYFQGDDGSTYMLVADNWTGSPTVVTNTTAGGSIERYPTHNNKLETVSSAHYEGELMALIRKHIGNDEYEWYYIWTGEFWNGTTINPHILGGFIGGVFDF